MENFQDHPSFNCLRNSGNKICIQTDHIQRVDLNSPLSVDAWLQIGTFKKTTLFKNRLNFFRNRNKQSFLFSRIINIYLFLGVNFNVSSVVHIITSTWRLLDFCMVNASALHLGISYFFVLSFPSIVQSPCYTSRK